MTCLDIDDNCNLPADLPQSFTRMAKTMGLDKKAVYEILVHCDQLGLKPGEQIEVTFLALTGRINMLSREFPDYIAEIERVARDNVGGSVGKITGAARAAASEIRVAGAAQVTEITRVNRAVSDEMGKAVIECKAASQKLAADTAKITEDINKASAAAARVAVNSAVRRDIDGAGKKIVSDIMRQIDILTNDKIKLIDRYRSVKMLLFTISLLAICYICWSLGINQGYILGQNDVRSVAVEWTSVAARPDAQEVLRLLSFNRNLQESRSKYCFNGSEMTIKSVDGRTVCYIPLYLEPEVLAGQRVTPENKK